MQDGTEVGLSMAALLVVKQFHSAVRHAMQVQHGEALALAEAMATMHGINVAIEGTPLLQFLAGC